MLIIIPAYNEEENIADVIKGAIKYLPAAKILVVDDGSTDATGTIARNMGAVVITHPRNLGVGAALRRGYIYAIENHFDRILQIDGDGQHDPKYLPLLLRELANADVVIGSRFLPGSFAYPIPLCRRIGMLLFSFIARKKTGISLTDTTSGYRAYSRRAVRWCLCGDWEYPDANLLVWLAKSGMAVAETPVRMYANRQGKSFHVGMEPIYYVYKMLLNLGRG